MSKQTLTGTTKMEPNGRVLIPVAIRKSLNLIPDNPMVIVVQDNQLVIKNTLQVWEELRQKFTKAYKGNRLLSEELIEDRRKEAILEGYV